VGAGERHRRTTCLWIVGGGCSGEEVAKYAHTLMAGDAGRVGIAESGVGRWGVMPNSAEGRDGVLGAIGMENRRRG
jgi:hypothetical protein